MHDYKQCEIIFNIKKIIKKWFERKQHYHEIEKHIKIINNTFIRIQKRDDNDIKMKFKNDL